MSPFGAVARAIKLEMLKQLCPVCRRAWSYWLLPCPPAASLCSSRSFLHQNTWKQAPHLFPRLCAESKQTCHHRNNLSLMAWPLYTHWSVHFTRSSPQRSSSFDMLCSHCPLRTPRLPLRQEPSAFVLLLPWVDSSLSLLFHGKADIFIISPLLLQESDSKIWKRFFQYTAQKILLPLVWFAFVWKSVGAVFTLKSSEERK